MNYTLLRDEWIGPSNEVFISFDVFDEDLGQLAWNSDYIDTTDPMTEFDLNEFRKEIIKQCEIFELTTDLTADDPAKWGEEWNERVIT